MMRTLLIYSMVALFGAAIAIASPSDAHAQNRNVEVNLDVLDAIAPHHAPPNDVPLSIPLQSIDAPQPFLQSAPPLPQKKPSFISSDILAQLSGTTKSPSKLISDQGDAPPPSPQGKPPLPQPSSVEIVPPPRPAVLLSSPPLPPKRPQKFKASASLVAQALKNTQSSPSSANAAIKQSLPIQNKKTARVKATASTKVKAQPKAQPQVQSQAKNNIQTRHDPLGKTLKDPSVEDILASIDPQSAQSDIEEENDAGTPRVSLGYSPGVTALPEDMKAQLQVKTLRKSEQFPNGKIEIRSYASTKGGDEITARRTSLARALEIRGILIGVGIESRRIELLPLGDSAENEPRDRTDILFAQPD